MLSSRYLWLGHSPLILSGTRAALGQEKWAQGFPRTGANCHLRGMPGRPGKGSTVRAEAGRGRGTAAGTSEWNESAEEEEEDGRSFPGSWKENGESVGLRTFRKEEMKTVSEAARRTGCFAGCHEGIGEEAVASVKVTTEVS